VIAYSTPHIPRVRLSERIQDSFMTVLMQQLPSRLRHHHEIADHKAPCNLTGVFLINIRMFLRSSCKVARLSKTLADSPYDNGVFAPGYFRK
jgi:hypothetical protein